MPVDEAGRHAGLRLIVSRKMAGQRRVSGGTDRLVPMGGGTTLDAACKSGAGACASGGGAAATCSGTRAAAALSSPTPSSAHAAKPTSTAHPGAPKVRVHVMRPAILEEVRFGSTPPRLVAAPTPTRATTSARAPRVVTTRAAGERRTAGPAGRSGRTSCSTRASLARGPCSRFALCQPPREDGSLRPVRGELDGRAVVGRRLRRTSQSAQQIRAPPAARRTRATARRSRAPRSAGERAPRLRPPWGGHSLGETRRQHGSRQ